MSSEPSVRDLGMSSQQPPMFSRGAIRVLDVVGAGLGLLLLWPLFLVLGLAIKLTSRGPALFCSTRIGQFGRPFVLYKFRSMSDGSHLHGPVITAANDPRVTPLGKVLRRLKIDELPQLINVLRGDMSLVGPRPEAPSYVARYSREQLKILEVKPGLTSPASLRYRNEEQRLTGMDWEDYYVRELMPAKLAIDADYIRKRTPWSDMRLILATIATLVGYHAKV